jgi:hypothetical protein
MALGTLGQSFLGDNSVWSWFVTIGAALLFLLAFYGFVKMLRFDALMFRKDDYSKLAEQDSS